MKVEQEVMMFGDNREDVLCQLQWIIGITRVM